MTVHLPIPIRTGLTPNRARGQWLVDVSLQEIGFEEAPVVATWEESRQDGRRHLHEYRSVGGELWMPLLPSGATSVEEVNDLSDAARRSTNSRMELAAEKRAMINEIQTWSGLVSARHLLGYDGYQAGWQDVAWSEVGSTQEFEASRRLDERMLAIGGEIWVRSSGPVVRVYSDAATMQRHRSCEVDPLWNALVLSAFAHEEALEHFRTHVGALEDRTGARATTIGDVGAAETAVLSESAEWSIWHFLWSERQRHHASGGATLEVLVEAREVLQRRWGDAASMRLSVAGHLARHLPGADIPEPTALMPVLESIVGLGSAVSKEVQLGAAIHAHAIKRWQDRSDMKALGAISF